MGWAGGLESWRATWEESAAVSSAASQAPPLPPPSSAHPPPHLQLQLLAKQFLIAAVHLGGSLPLLHLHLQQLVILLLRICTEEEGGFVIISIKK